MRTLSLALALITTLPSPAAVIVLSNFSKDEITVTIVEPMGKPQTVKLTAFQVVPVTVGGPADITFSTTGGKKT
ncbi:MAG TPA: hypothetical protein VMZ71_08160, partial [Gemmataceae bacterium]|nr:hypothetical protein [Gemmataceae bacterium]